jgi:hypothetical protein
MTLMDNGSYRVALLHPRHCEEHSDVAIHGLGTGGTHWIAALRSQ